MDNSRIINPTPQARAFLDEWSGGGCVTAHTSGSTGEPKRISLDRNDMIASARATNAFLGIDSSSVMALPLSADYIAGKMMIVRAMVAGCVLHVAPPSLDALAPFAHLQEIDLMPVVPAQLPALLTHDRVASRIKNLIIGGAPISPGQERQVTASGVRAFATYGMTETCSHVALRRIGASEAYEALPGFSFSTDSRGCLVISSEHMSFGELTTNDCVELQSPGRFVWLGRADNVINSGGIKIHPEKLEAALAPLIGGRAFYISGRPSQRWGSEIVLTVEGSGFDTGRFMAAAKELLPARMLPKAVIEMEELPRTASGKIIRSNRSVCDGSPNGTR